MKKIINTIFLTLYFGLSIYLIIILHEILNVKELLIIIAFLTIIELLFIYLFKKNVLLFFSYPCILFVLMCLFTFNMKNTDIISFASNIQDDINNKYYLVTLNENMQNPKNIGYLKKIPVFNNLDIEYNPICYDDINVMIKDLNSQKIDAIIVSDNTFKLFDINKYKKFLELKMNEEIIPTFKNNSNTKLIYVTSLDINIILGLNKKTRQIAIISIPENYYLPFRNESETISNINKYGISESINIVEKLIDNKIDNYIKIDFNSLPDLIDKIGGIEVESDYDFVSLGSEYKKGFNKLNGEEAVTFAKYSNPLMGGSRIQSTNQIKVLSAIMNRLIDDNSFIESLDEIKDVIKTNIPSSEIMKFIKDQFIYNYKWNIIDYILDGSDKYEFTYSSKCCKLSVIVPDIITVNNAITTIEYLKSNSIFN